MYILGIYISFAPSRAHLVLLRRRRRRLTPQLLASISSLRLFLKIQFSSKISLRCNDIPRIFLESLLLLLFLFGRKLILSNFKYRDRESEGEKWWLKVDSNRSCWSDIQPFVRGSRAAMPKYSMATIHRFEVRFDFASTNTWNNLLNLVPDLGSIVEIDL